MQQMQVYYAMQHSDSEVESLQINSTPDVFHPLESDTNLAEMNKSSWHSSESQSSDWSVKHQL